MTAKATRYSQRFRLVSVSQVRAMDRTAQLRGKYQSACKSHGSTCICLGIGCWCSARSECTGPAAVYTWSPLEPRPVMPRRRPWQKYRKPTGVISFVVPPPKSRGCHLVHLRRTRRRTTKSLPRAEPKLDRIELPPLWRGDNGSPSQSLKQVAFGPRRRSAGRYEKRAVILASPQSNSGTGQRSVGGACAGPTGGDNRG
jgi:hypothetical protein